MLYNWYRYLEKQQSTDIMHSVRFLFWSRIQQMLKFTSATQVVTRKVQRMALQAIGSASYKPPESF
jgi:hypothetical protein